MLPVIELCAIDICETGFSPHSGKVELIGNAFWFSWNAVVKAARKASLNIDRFLTIRLGLFIVKKKPKSNILIFYTPIQDRFVLTICSRRRISFFNAFQSTAGIPRYLEYGRDYVPITAHPFVYYGGMGIFRVYDVNDPDPDAFYVCDFGNLFGLTTSATPKYEYFKISTDPQSYVEYSVVPSQPTEELIVSGINLRLQHAFCKMVT